MIFFVSIIGLRFQRYSKNRKRYSPKNFFENSEFCSSRQNHSMPNSLENWDFGGKNKTQSFQKLFWGDIFFCLLNIFETAAQKSKHIKHYCSILAIVNHRDWLDDSPPLNALLNKYWGINRQKESKAELVQFPSK